MNLRKKNKVVIGGWGAAGNVLVLVSSWMVMYFTKMSP